MEESQTNLSLKPDWSGVDPATTLRLKALDLKNTAKQLGITEKIVNSDAIQLSVAELTKLREAGKEEGKEELPDIDRDVASMISYALETSDDMGQAIPIAMHDFRDDGGVTLGKDGKNPQTHPMRRRTDTPPPMPVARHCVVCKSTVHFERECERMRDR